MNNTLRTKAIVLRRTNYGEADRIVQFLTPQHGKLSVMAKGVRREKSKLAGGIELFSVSDITVIGGRGKMGTLTGVRHDKAYQHIITDYDRLQFGYEAIKQVSSAAEQLDDEAFFLLLEETFGHLDDKSVRLAVTEAWFWLQLGIIIGTSVNLATDNNGMKLVEDARYKYDTTDHALAFHENGTLSSDHIKLLRLLSAQSPKVAMQVGGIDELIDDCLWVARHGVAH